MQCAYKRGKPLQCADTMTMTPFALLFRNLTNDEFITIAERTIKLMPHQMHLKKKMVKNLKLHVYRNVYVYWLDLMFVSIFNCLWSTTVYLSSIREKIRVNSCDFFGNQLRAAPILFFSCTLFVVGESLVIPLPELQILILGQYFFK